MGDSIREAFRITIQTAAENRMDGIEGIAAELGKSANYLYRGANLNGNEGPFDLFQLAHLIDITKDTRIVDALAQNCGLVLIDWPKAKSRTKADLTRQINDHQLASAQLNNSLISLRDFNDEDRAKKATSRIRVMMRLLTELHFYINQTNQMSLL